jgi:alpha-L-fucosidase 2
MNNPQLKFKYCFLLFTFCFSLSTCLGQPRDNDLVLWYDQPAADWNQALPVGNGSLGAMVFGGIQNERLQLNEKTIWAGGKEDFVNPLAKTSLGQIRHLLFDGKFVEAQDLAQSSLMGGKKNASMYQTLGDLNFSFDHAQKSFTGYRRELDIQKAVAGVAYKAGNINFKRTIFSSAPDNVIVIRLEADRPGSISFNAVLSRPGNGALVRYSKDEIILTEHINGGRGVNVVARIRVIANKGKVSFSDSALSVSKSDDVTVLISAATDYWKGNPLEITNKVMASAVVKKFGAILAGHIQDYQQYFNRVSLDLGKGISGKPTDQRLQALQKGTPDPQLMELYYQFGRYLLISSSRPGGLPANLQGIWADGLNPPWDADYHININIQMNYWPAEITGLHEMHLPFLQFIDRLREDGKKTAADMYGMKGAVAHFTTDAWNFTEPYGKTQWAMWPMGFAWSTQHLWQHYLFSEEKSYLDTLAYPVMKDAAEFCLNWLTEDPVTKFLVSGPSISPENTFLTNNGEVATMVMGPTMDRMIIRELFTSTIKASLILGKDEPLRIEMQRALEKLAPTRLTSDGRIMEWTEEFKEAEPGHRHLSHLYGLFPGSEITMQSNPELLQAAKKTIAFRLSHGGGHTGWSRAWIINFFARLQDGDEAYSNLMALLNKSTLPNLFDNHPPFQIDGNFGATAGITEMIVQSHAGEIHVLPALPSAWNSGSMAGICARGGFTVDVAWSEGKLKLLKIHSKNGNPCHVRYRDKTVTFNTEAGKVYGLNGFLAVADR